MRACDCFAVCCCLRVTGQIQFCRKLVLFASDACRLVLYQGSSNATALKLSGCFKPFHAEYFPCTPFSDLAGYYDTQTLLMVAAKSRQQPEVILDKTTSCVMCGKCLNVELVMYDRAIAWQKKHETCVSLPERGFRRCWNFAQTRLPFREAVSCLPFSVGSWKDQQRTPG